MIKKPIPIHAVLLIFALMLTFLKSHVVFSEEVEVSDSLINTSVQDLADELAWLREENYVTIATKSKQKISKAPSIVTVITAEEIENMGFRTLPEVLRIVPGFDIIKDATFGIILSGVRGIRNADNKIKVLIDGHSLNMPYNGGAAFFLMTFL
ncbi:MAG: TonB-dependent receptor [Candidatus Anammoxibacter sp.]